MLTPRKIHNFLKIAKERAKLSPDLETQVGAILVDKESLDIVATGYNGFIRNSSKNLPRTRPNKYPYMIHAEANLLYNSLKRGVILKDSILFCTHSPCEQCIRALYQSGITLIIFKTEHHTYKSLIALEDLSVDIVKSKTYTELRVSPRI